MPVQNATVLKSYYETGDKPTQQQFGDLIDSLQEARDNALTALTTAVSAQVVATSALSAANNRVLRAGDTMTGALIIDGSADTEQLHLIGHTSQTDPILFIQDSALATLLSVSNTGNLTAVGNLILGAAGAVSRLKVPSSGVITLTDNGDTGFDRLQFGGTTAAFPALRRSSAALDVRLADDSAFAALTSGLMLITQGTITTDLKNLEGSVTWNNSGVTFEAWKLSVIATAAGTTSRYISILKDGNDFCLLDNLARWHVFRQTADLSGGSMTLFKRGTTGDATAAIVADTTMGFFSSRGWNGSAYHSDGTGIQILSDELFTGSNGGTRIEFRVVPLGSAINNIYAKLQASALTLQSGCQLVITRGTLTADAPSILATETWNAGGVTFTAWKLNVTNTASAAASALLDLQVGASSKFFVGLTGNLLISAGTITTNINQISTTATWNAGGVTFTGWKMNVTDTASATGSRLVDLQVGGTPKCAIDKAGVLLIGFTLPTLASNFEGGIQIANSATPSADPDAGIILWADGTTDEWFYRTAAPDEGAGSRFRVHNRLDLTVGSGTDYSLTNSTAAVDFGGQDPIVTIPTAGTFLIIATVQFGSGATAGDELHAKIRNTTDSVDVGFESFETMPATNGFVTLVLERRHVNTLGTSQDLQIFAHNATAAQGTIISTSTSLKFIRLY